MKRLCLRRAWAIHSVWAAWAVCGCISGAALAQTRTVAQAKVSGPELQDVEKGFYIDWNIGPAIALTGPLKEQGKGVVAGLNFGYDFSDFIAAEMMMGVIEMSSGEIPNEQLIEHKIDLEDPTSFELKKNDPSYQGIPPEISDFATFFLAGAAKLNLVSTKRFYFYMKAGGGISLNKPENVLTGENYKRTQPKEEPPGINKPIVVFGPGVEYYTGLRHFSVGLEARMVMVPSPMNLSLAPVFSVKYTF